MKILAWYTAVLNTLIIIALILLAVEVINPPPFSLYESIFWIVLTFPVVLFGFRFIREHA
ncbi:MAG: hypothetical protein V3S02_01275 [Dehalococcoidales bacterium]